MFRAFGANGPPATNTAPPAAATTNGSHHQAGSGKDTSSLFFNQIENNLRSWHSTNYCLSSPPPTTTTTTTTALPRAPGHGSVGSGFTDTDRAHGLSQLPQQQSQYQHNYDNVLRMMMSTAPPIAVTKARTPTNQTRSNGNLFNKFYGRMYYSLRRTPIKCLSR